MINFNIIRVTVEKIKWSLKRLPIALAKCIAKMLGFCRMASFYGFFSE